MATSAKKFQNFKNSKKVKAYLLWHLFQNRFRQCLHILIGKYVRLYQSFWGVLLSPWKALLLCLNLSVSDLLVDIHASLLKFLLAHQNIQNFCSCFEFEIWIFELDGVLCLFLQQLWPLRALCQIVFLWHLKLTGKIYEIHIIQYTCNRYIVVSQTIVVLIYPHITLQIIAERRLKIFCVQWATVP